MNIIQKGTAEYVEHRETIGLFTSKNNPIDNFKLYNLSSTEVKQFKDNHERHPLLKFTGKATGIYNCHGFTFASRRTSISDSKSLRKILEDDNYISINIKDVEIGDVVLYVSNDRDADISHSGMVVRIDPSLVKNSIFVLSKWGRYKETVHSVWEHDYENCKPEFYRVNHGYIEQ